MVVGVLAQRAVCEPLKNPQDNRMFALVDEIVQIKKILYPNKPNADVNMSYIITYVPANITSKIVVENFQLRYSIQIYFFLFFIIFITTETAIETKRCTKFSS